MKLFVITKYSLADGGTEFYELRAWIELQPL